MITINNKEYRNLQEQVLKNKEDIAQHYEIDRVLADWGITVLGIVSNTGELPMVGNSYGDAYGVGSAGNFRAPWPGELMTYDSSVGLYKYVFEKKFVNVIFNNNAGSQTDDLSINAGYSEETPYFNGSTWVSLPNGATYTPVTGKYTVFYRNYNWSSHYCYVWEEFSSVSYYIWTRANPNIGEYNDYWLSVGALSLIGPQGPQGDRGPQGIQGNRGTLWYTGTSAPYPSTTYLDQDLYLDTTSGNVYRYFARLDNPTLAGHWSLLGSIKGPQGAVGPKGDTGAQGIAGPIGPQGVKGDAGQSFELLGKLASTDLLPTPTEEYISKAYAVGTEENYDMYVIIPDEDDTLLWTNMGRISGVTGPQGPQGPQGEPGLGATVVVGTEINSNPLTGIIANGNDMSEIINSRTAVILFNNEMYYPADLPTTGNIWIFSHTGELNGNVYVKTLALDLSTALFTIIVIDVPDTIWVTNRISSSVSGLASEQYVATQIAESKATEVLIDVPAGSTNGTITADQLAVLQANKANYITFNNQIYRLQDNENDAGMLTYTYSGHSNDIVSKTISITISTLAWTLSTVSITSAITGALTEVY